MSHIDGKRSQVEHYNISTDVLAKCFDVRAGPAFHDPAFHMHNNLVSYSPTMFPLFFIGMWLIVTTLLGLLSGWFQLQREFPDREDRKLITLSSLSGFVGIVGMNGILSITVCESGLRIGMLRIFGPFCRKFFVPWERITIERKLGIMGKTAKLNFGQPLIGYLKIPYNVADHLARSARGHWPETGDFPKESNGSALKSIFYQWFISTLIASLFFTIAPRIAIPNSANYPPVAIGILFPALVFGVASIFRYFYRIKTPQ